MKHIINVVSNVFLVFAISLVGSCRNESLKPEHEHKPDIKKPFVTIWELPESESSSDNGIITIPINPEFNYNYNIKWSKVDAPNVNGEKTGITDGGNVVVSGDGKYSIGRKYKIEISGVFPAIYFDEKKTDDGKKLISVEQWGDIEWKSMNRAFAGCSNLVINAKDSPDLSRVTDMTSMFYGAKSFNQSIENWDVSNITVMDFMFYGAESFNQPLNRWNVVSVSHMSHMFERAISFDQNLNSWSLRMKEDVGRTHMFRDAKSFAKRTRISSWELNNSTCKELFGSKC